jgi:hypothetical protein
VLGRVVRHLAGEEGVRQFLDIGTGIPKADTVHEVAQRIAPDARIVSVDYDPVVLAHAHQFVSGTAEGACAYVQGDLHLARDVEGEAVAETFGWLNETMSESVTLRTQDQVAGFFRGLELVPPGVVQVPDWRPDAGARGAMASRPVPLWCGVGRTREACEGLAPCVHAVGCRGLSP